MVLPLFLSNVQQWRNVALVRVEPMQRYTFICLQYTIFLGIILAAGVQQPGRNKNNPTTKYMSVRFINDWYR